LVQRKPVDQRSDIFSIGCIIHDAAMRRRPFAADSDVEVMHRILRATITCSRLGGTEVDGIYIARADGGGAPRRIVRQIDSMRRAYYPKTFTPDGASLVAEKSSDGKITLGLVPVAPETGDSEDKLSPLRIGPGSEFAPRFSPDGGWLAWSSDQSGTEEVYVGPLGATQQ
jgi:Tol biopolymer transport system component